MVIGNHHYHRGISVSSILIYQLIIHFSLVSSRGEFVHSLDAVVVVVDDDDVGLVFVVIFDGVCMTFLVLCVLCFFRFAVSELGKYQSTVLFFFR